MVAEYINTDPKDNKPEHRYYRTYYLIRSFFRDTLPSFYLNDSFTSALWHHNLYKEFENLLNTSDRASVETLHKALKIYKRLYIESKKYKKFRRYT